MKRYLLVVEGGTEPVVSGPYSSDKDRFEDALNALERSETGIFRVDVLAGEKLRVSPFLNSEFDPKITQ